MKQNFYQKVLIGFLLALTCHNSIQAQVVLQGNVFKDFNFDGIKQLTGARIEYGMPGITINIYNNANVLIATKISTQNTNTAISGDYSFTVAEGVPANTAIRVEFVHPSYLHPTRSGGASTTPSDIQFVTTGVSGTPTIVNAGFSGQLWYSSEDNPYLATNLGNAGTLTGTSANKPNLHVFPWSMTTPALNGTPDDGGAARRLPHSQTGSIFGLTTQTSSRTLFMAAYPKRHVDFGPGGISAIYRTQIPKGTGIPAAAVGLVRLDTIGLNFGTNPRTSNPYDTLPTNGNFPSQDSSMFSQIGRIGIGGISMSDDGRFMYIVNMFQNRLHRLNVGNPIKSSFRASDVISFNIPAIANNPLGLIFHPMACKSYNGRIYVGGVLVKHITGPYTFPDSTGQRLIVLALNPTLGNWTEVLRHKLTYRKGYTNAEVRYPRRNNWWCAWQLNGDSAALVGGLNPNYVSGQPNTNNSDGGIQFPQPMLSDIEFDMDGSMVLAIRDRFGDQMGFQNFSADRKPQFGFGGTAANPTNLRFRVLAGADLLKAGAVNENRYVMESAGTVNTFGLQRKSFRADSIRTAFNAASNPPPANATNNWTWRQNGGLGGNFPYYVNQNAPGNNVPYGGFFGPDWEPGASYLTPYDNPDIAGIESIDGGSRGAYFYYNHDYDTEPGERAGVYSDNNYPATMNGRTTVGTNRAHYLKGNGGIAIFAGGRELASTAIDPYQSSFANGVLKFNNQTGELSQRLQLRGPDPITGLPVPTIDEMGKGTVTGDLELITDRLPLEVGNRVWIDTDGDGLQDAGEVGLSGVVLSLYAPGPNGVFEQTGASGSDDILLRTETTNARGEYYFFNLTTPDLRKSASFIGIDNNGIVPFLNYQIRIVNASGPATQTSLLGYTATKVDVAANAFDNVDSDGTRVGNDITVNFNISQPNHSFDFGIRRNASLGDKVWLDNNKDGTQNSGEPGVAGITVELFRNGLDGLPNTTDDQPQESIVTDAYGMYLFQNLAPNLSGVTSDYYNVRFTLPANYRFTNQTNRQTALGKFDPTVTGTFIADSTIGSDAVNLPLAYGSTGSIFLDNGEVNLSIDAGIIHLEPSTNCLGDRVWLDIGNGTAGTAANGLQDTGEPGLSGVTVSLLKETSSGSGVFAYEASTITNATGYYEFCKLPNNTNYQIRFDLPPGAILTTNIGGTTPADATTNSDPNPITRTTATINIPPGGGSFKGVDAGIILIANNRAAIGDRVWYDQNRNNRQDPNEPGIPNVTVELYASNKTTLLGTTTTNVFGYYVFNDLAPSNGTTSAANGYFVKFGTVADMTLVQPNLVTGSNDDDALDSDASASGFTQGYFLNPGERNMSADAGFFSLQPAGVVGALGDKVWNDLNFNNSQDTGEPGVAGVGVTLFTSGNIEVSRTTTDRNGMYLFTNLTPGSYYVIFSNIPQKYSLVKPNIGAITTDSDPNPATGRTPNVTVVGGGTVTTVDAGLIQGTPNGLASLGNFVWYDNTGATPNVQDLNELGVTNITVELFQDVNLDGTITGSENTAIQRTKTNSIGNYIFRALPAGIYQVRFSNIPSGFSAVSPNVGTNDDLDSDGVSSGGGVFTTGLYTLLEGEDNLSVDLGIVPTSPNTNTLGDYVWLDRNANGIQDAGERGVEGVTVKLLNNINQILAGTTTDINGRYIFVGLADGNYSVRFENFPAGLDLTTKSLTNTTTGSDAEQITGQTDLVALSAANRNDSTLDAGLITTSRAVLGDYVWHDLNRDGVQNANEPVVTGATVLLDRPGFGLDGIAGNGDDALPVASRITTAEGRYIFTNLLPGTYQVSFTTKTNFTDFTLLNSTTAGGNSTTDSDAIPATGRTGNVVLNAGDVNLTVDGGIVSPIPASIGNRVWADRSKEGLQDPSELGVAGVVVILRNSTNDAIGSSITNGDGLWRITEVPPGNGYTCLFNPNLISFITNTTVLSATQQGWTVANTGAGGTNALDNPAESDADSDVTRIDPNNGLTGSFSINAGDSLVNIDAGIIIEDNFVVPIQLIDFTATPVQKNVQVRWSVATETDVLHYEIEYSFNGISFASFAKVTATGARNYGSLHTNTQNGANYYRLKIVDQNGIISYSPVRRVNFSSDVKDIKLYPIPAHNNVIVSLPSVLVGKPAQLVLYTVDGKLTVQKSIASLQSNETIDVSKYASGKYYLRILTANEVIVKSIEIAR